MEGKAKTRLESSNQKRREKVGTRREGWNQKGMLEPGGKAGTWMEGWNLDRRLEPGRKAGTWREREKAGTRREGWNQEGKDGSRRGS